MNEWYAVEALNEGFERMKMLLFTTFDLKLWLKLALVVMLAGVIGSMNQEIRISMPADVGESVDMALLIAVFAVILVIALAIIYLGAVSNFVYVESLSKGRINLGDYFKEQARNGLSLFLLDILAIILLIIVFVATMVIVVSTITAGSILTLLGVVFMFFVFFILILAYMLLFWVVADFIIPIMYARNMGLFQALGELEGLIKPKLRQFLVYTLLRIALGIGGLVVYMIVAVPLLIATMFLFLIPYVLAFGLGPFAIAVVTVVYFLAMVGVVYLITFITLPVSVFFRYYSLAFMQMADPTLTLLKPLGGAG